MQISLNQAPVFSPEVLKHAIYWPIHKLFWLLTARAKVSRTFSEKVSFLFHNCIDFQITFEPPIPTTSTQRPVF